ncbi:uncharacterized protein [Bemisia tabaci]|uniref:uncharacterized protein isoform X2 n=1 Tax=Bemisia tabaci TaxID=7038 RepID=UPI0008F9ADDA|nr:PREDICTED: uncharacterized protein LOC109041468 isoform X2 [Bemisia tabaci]
MCSLSISSLTESYLVCYECTVHPPSSHSNQTARLCSKFDASAHFQVECPYSTFCMRRSFKLDLKDGKTVNAVERGCASQKYQYQSFYDGKWHAEEAVEDKVYRPGCYPAEQLGLKTPTTEYCYCPTNLCNSAKSTQEYGTGFHHTDTMAVIIVFNAVKYIRSLR